MNVERLRSVLSQGTLPGPAAHEPMRATPVGPVIPRFEHKLPPKPGSVLILLVKQEESYFFPLIKRAEYAGAHSSQISLPGGKAEAGESTIETALREAQEEIGIDPMAVDVLGTLSNFFVIPSNFMVTPVVGLYQKPGIFTPDDFEVARILQGSLDALLKEDAIKTRDILAANRFPMRAPHFEIDGEVVWGATAMMLNEFRLVCRNLLVDDAT